MSVGESNKPNKPFVPPHIVPSRGMILRLFEQEVQISGTKTGCLVSATLRNHVAVRVSPSYFLGTRYQGTFFLGYFLWGEQQEVTRH
jgi:hypothetical protein